jgi:hypothetical protein
VADKLRIKFEVIPDRGQVLLEMLRAAAGENYFETTAEVAGRSGAK